MPTYYNPTEAPVELKDSYGKNIFLSPGETLETLYFCDHEVLGLTKIKNEPRFDINSGVSRIHCARDIQTIAADTAIDSSSILAIAPETDVNVYFGTDASKTMPIKAYSVFGIYKGRDVKLASTTKCFIF